MHSCLNVDEILRLIACELAVSGAKATTVSLACCCKSFEDPVLDALWETQGELFPLLKSLPGNAWKVEAAQFVSILTGFTFSSDRSVEEVFHQTPNEGGMDSYPKICSRNTVTHSGRHQGPDDFGCSISAAVSCWRRTFVSETGGL